jgi:AcrR family transcriptional regulator
VQTGPAEMKKVIVMPRKSVQEERRIQIYQALTKCLLKKSFSETSIKDIAKTARLNHGVLHYYFKSKEDILLNYIDYVVVHYHDMYQEWVGSHSGRTIDKKTYFRDFAEFMMDRLTLNDTLSRVFVEIWEISMYNKKVRLKLQDLYREWYRTLAQVIGHSFPKSAEARRIIRMLVPFCEGVSLFSVLMPKSELNVKEIMTWMLNNTITMLNRE